jgi:hypothetical protein
MRTWGIAVLVVTGEYLPSFLINWGGATHKNIRVNEDLTVEYSWLKQLSKSQLGSCTMRDEAYAECGYINQASRDIAATPSRSRRLETLKRMVCLARTEAIFQETFSHSLARCL